MTKKRILIISPYFPPSNTPDMQRIRMSLPYFNTFGWEAEVVMVDERFSDLAKEPLLLESIPEGIKIHRVSALSKKWTSKFGLGSLSLRSLMYYRKYVDKLLKTEKFDLVYFSTTEYPVTVLGRYWKRKFGIPYVIDIQDPWHSEHYKMLPKHQRPKKYWFSYRLNKFLEPIAMDAVDGLISVSLGYIEDLINRYPVIKSKPTATIPFSFFEKDFEIARGIQESQPLVLDQRYVNLVYTGRGGFDLHKALDLLFEGFKLGLKSHPEEFKNLRFHFIGTSYAPKGTGIKTILPLAEKHGVSAYVREETDRIGFYNSLNYISGADGVIIPGSDDPNYTASKIYPYILSKKPLLAIFDRQSSAAKIVRECRAGSVATFQDPQAVKIIGDYLHSLSSKSNREVETDMEKFKKYSAEQMTRYQCELFDKVMAQKPKP
jgi:hypothetical protein